MELEETFSTFQGLRAEATRAARLTQLDTWEELQRSSAASEGSPTQPFTLIIEINAWNTREREQWRQTEALREKGEKISRWHWVCVVTVFGLDHRGHATFGPLPRGGTSLERGP